MRDTEKETAERQQEGRERAGKKLHEQRLAYSVGEFCHVSGLGRTLVFAMLRDGRLSSVRVAGRRLIPVAAARALLSPEVAQ